jgi:hypothetical protein
LETCDDDLILLFEVASFKLEISMVVKPHDLSILEVVHVKLLEVLSHTVHLVGDLALWSVLERPVTTSEDLCCKLNV